MRLIKSGYSFRSILDLSRMRKRHIEGGSLVNLTWDPNQSDLQINSQGFKELRVAVTAHIFYEDFVEPMFQLLENIPCEFDLLVTTSSPKIVEDLKRKMDSNSVRNLVRLECKISQNIGRNFGPLLVEFSELLRNSYDVFLHIHSKKSLHSGTEQTMWRDHLINNLLGTKNLVSGILSEFATDIKLGLVYPTTVPGMPSWVNGWGKNILEAKKLSSEIGVNSPENGFHVYPVGGMFWGRSECLKQLLDKDWKYEDFPAEIGQTDGTIQHAIERMISFVGAENGFKSRFLHNQQLTSDNSFAWRDSGSSALDRLVGVLPKYGLISWDFFDTLVQREFGFPDLAKFRVGKVLVQEGLLENPNQYVKIRNSVEDSLRSQLKGKSDLNLMVIVSTLVKEHELDIDPVRLANLEFEEDLKQFYPRIDIENLYRANVLKSVITSDSYYSSSQLNQILHHVNLPRPLAIFVSSEIGSRKDRGDIWPELIKRLNLRKTSFIHIGDNVISDNQVPGDFGLTTFHTPTSFEIAKMIAPDFYSSFSKIDNSAYDNQEANTAARVIQSTFSSPFIGE